MELQSLSYLNNNILPAETYLHEVDLSHTILTASRLIACLQNLYKRKILRVHLRLEFGVPLWAAEDETLLIGAEGKQCTSIVERIALDGLPLKFGQLAKILKMMTNVKILSLRYTPLSADDIADLVEWINHNPLHSLDVRDCFLTPETVTALAAVAKNQPSLLRCFVPSRPRMMPSALASSYEIAVGELELALLENRRVPIKPLMHAFFLACIIVLGILAHCERLMTYHPLIDATYCV